MEDCLLEFTDYLSNEREMAKNSTLAYGRDLNDFLAFIKEKEIINPKEVTNTEIISYLFFLKNEGRSTATVNRKFASLRTFFCFLSTHKGMAHDPTNGIKTPKVERKEMEYLSLEEVEQLLSNPNDSVKGIRDKALLEMLYASGMRVSEAVGTDLSSVNLRIGFIMIDEDVGKARIVPLGRPARAALEKYIYEARPAFLCGEKSEEEALFLNYLGARLSRQGIWKIIRENAKGAGIKNKITPKMLRNSFAIHMIQNGADIKTLQELLGHEDVTATQVYLNYSKNRIKDVYDNAHPRA